MTALDATSDSDEIKPKAPNRVVPSTSQGPSGRDKAPKRAISSPWCCATLWTTLVVILAYVAGLVLDGSGAGSNAT